MEARGILTSAQSAEVLGGLGASVGVQLELDTAGSGAADGDVHEDLRAEKTRGGEERRGRGRA